MIKKWIEFIKESNHYWLDISDIGDSFISLDDEGYKITIDYAYFMQKNNDIICLNPKEDIIVLGEYYPGFIISIEKSKERTENITPEFKGALSSLKNEGYIIKIFGYDEELFVNNLHFVKGSIINWEPKEVGKPLPQTQGLDQISQGDSYSSYASITIEMHQPNKVEILPEDLAKAYKWSEYTSDKSGNIYCDVDIEDMADLFLKHTQYKEQLINGIDYMYYDSSYYQPKNANDLIDELSKENEVLFIKCLIKEMGGLEKLTKEFDVLDGMSEDEVINFLTKERFHSTIDELFKDSEIIDDIKQTIADFRVQAHIDRNQKELESEFDRIITKEGIEFQKEHKMGKRYYYTTIPNTTIKERVYYDEMVWFYNVKFQERWIKDFDKSLFGEDLNTVFYEWCYDFGFDNKLDPRFSDWGYVDRNELNSEIGYILKNYLK